MIYIPIFRQLPTIGTYIVSEEQKQEIENKRNKVINILKSHKDGLTVRAIATQAGYDIRSTQAILAVLTKQGKIESVQDKQRKIWKERK
jgi:predicted transcriptional regulator